VPTRIVEAVVAVNAARKQAMAEKIERAFGGVSGEKHRRTGPDLQGRIPTICADAPSLVIVPYLQGKGARIISLRSRRGEGGQERLNLELWQ